MNIEQLRLKHRSNIVIHVARLYCKKSDPAVLQQAAAEFMSHGDLHALLDKIKIAIPILPPNVDHIYRGLKARIKKRNQSVL
jgi:hypothetical protein